MKKIARIFGGIIAILGILFVGKAVLSNETGSASANDANTVIIYNWGEYIDPDLIKNSKLKVAIQ